MEKYCFPVEGKYQSFFIVHFEKDLDIKLSKSYQWRAQIPRKHSNKWMDENSTQIESLLNRFFTEFIDFYNSWVLLIGKDREYQRTGILSNAERMSCQSYWDFRVEDIYWWESLHYSPSESHRTSVSVLRQLFGRTEYIAINCSAFHPKEVFL